MNDIEGMVHQDGEFWNFVCAIPGCTFTSIKWPSKDNAKTRGSEHLNEHETGEEMTPLDEFNKSVGI